MSTYHQVLKNAQQKLELAGRGEQAALLYLLELTNKDSHNLYMEYDNEMQNEAIIKYEQGIERLIAGEPLGHVIGFEWFYGYRFCVNGDVLIPRPETEELVANILARYDEHFASIDDVVAVDIGTGSGAIAISLKKEEANIHMLATDISEKAIEVAKQNAENNDAIVNFMVGDMLKPLIERKLKVDILISNPPYIPQEEVMEDSVVNYEPHVALFGGDDGLKFYRIIFENAVKVLKKQAMMTFEIGYDQKAAMSALVEECFPNTTYEIVKDMSGKDRMLFVYMNL